MTILSVVQQAAPRIGIAVPSVLFSDTSRTAVELQEAVNEAAKAMCDDFDWQQTKSIYTITGDGATTSFSLPPDYRRMPKATNFWPSEEPTTPIRFFLDLDDWLAEDVRAVTEITRRAIIYGNQLHIKPAVGNAATVKFPYVGNLTVIAPAGTVATKTEFTDDADTFLLDERALKLSLIWRWKAAKGRPYAQDKDEYDAVIDTLAGNSKGPRVLRIGRRRVFRDAIPSYPYNITP